MKRSVTERTQFSVIRFVMDDAVQYTQQNVYISSDVSQLKVSVLSANGTCRTRWMCTDVWATAHWEHLYCLSKSTALHIHTHLYENAHVLSTSTNWLKSSTSVTPSHAETVSYCVRSHLAFNRRIRKCCPTRCTSIFV